MTPHRLNDHEASFAQRDAPQGEPKRAAYEPPRIVTHSAEELQKILLTVNAATDLNPFP